MKGEDIATFLDLGWRDGFLQRNGDGSDGEATALPRFDGIDDETEFERHQKSMGLNAKASARAYKRDSEAVNSSLRAGRQPGGDVKGTIEGLDEATDHPVEQDLHVFRRMDMDPASMKVGHRYVDRGFTGTSYLRGHSKWGPNLVHVHVPKGTRGHFLDNEATMHLNHDEKEFLLHRGTSFHVLGHSETKVNGKPVKVVHVRASNVRARTL